jgi:chromosome segregation protein
LDGELEESKQVVEKTRETLVSIEDKVGILEKEQSYTREKVEALRSNLNNQHIQIAEKRSRLEFVHEEIEREYGIDLRLVDWKFEVWKARQPVENLPKLDLDTSESDADEDLDNNNGDAEVAKNGDIDVDQETEASEENVESEVTEDSEVEPALVPDNAAQKVPSKEELEELDATNWSKVKAEIKSLRKRVQGMGAVNTDAIEEYGELRERHLFLKTQCDDLITSRDKLVAAIEEINLKSREQFSETFSQIQANFKHTFETLFGGGKADLKLIEAEDVLESGIDIVAQPPGTRLKNITLLSGGQRTMTAVGLLFAIYMVKPSPFCLLDELDAPLDESNIGRFTGLLKQFTSQSQFIIITHNKRTIQAATAIYGVTMEEKGVSKVVSMKFNSEHDDPDIVSLQLAKEAVPA